MPEREPRVERGSRARARAGDVHNGFVPGGVPGIVDGALVQQVLPRRARERWPRVLVWKWPKSVSVKARFTMPPQPRRPVYGEAAKAEARRIVREARRERINLGPLTKRRLLSVIAGRRPLGFSEWRETLGYMARVRAARAGARRAEPVPAPAPFRVALAPGIGPRLVRS